MLAEKDLHTIADGIFFNLRFSGEDAISFVAYSEGEYTVWSFSWADDVAKKLFSTNSPIVWQHSDSAGSPLTLVDGQCRCFHVLSNGDFKQLHETNFINTFKWMPTAKVRFMTEFLTVPCDFRV